VGKIEDFLTEIAIYLGNGVI